MLSTLTNYNVWANKKILETLMQLPEGLIDAETNSSFPTLRKTIYHLWDAQIIWLNRLNGISLTEWPSKSYAKDFDGFDNYVIQQSEDFDRFVQYKSEDFLASQIYYKNMEGKEQQQKAWQLILHCMNHSTYHRGQLITMLRSFEVKNLPSTDLIFYLREQK